MELLDEFPELSRFKAARDRTYRIVRHEGEAKLFTPHGALPDGVELLAEGIVDWTKAEHVQARIARELAVANAGKEADFTGLIPPLEDWAETNGVTDETFDAQQDAISARLEGKAVT